MRSEEKDQDSNYTGADNRRLFIPYETMLKDFPLTGNMNTPDSLSAIIAAPYDYVVKDTIRFIDERGKMDFREGGPTEAEVRSILGPKLGFDVNDVEALSIWNTSMETVLFSKIITGMNEFFISVSVITMLLGGIGVMNIMLIAVKERTREIGIRKALGATTRTIQRQFFAEGMILTLLSGGNGPGNRRGSVEPREHAAVASALYGNDRYIGHGCSGDWNFDIDRSSSGDISRKEGSPAATHRGATLRNVTLMMWRNVSCKRVCALARFQVDGNYDHSRSRGTSRPLPPHQPVSGSGDDARDCLGDRDGRPADGLWERVSQCADGWFSGGVF